ncbi:MAG: SPOR domain-containing protein [Nitrospinae bacterium]|nr:SPOR domain-containing protein [Nitrospinota bacterium]
MIDDELREDHEDVHFGRGQIDEFTKELEAEEKSKKRRMYFGVAALLAAIGAGAFFSGILDDAPSQQGKAAASLNDNSKPAKAEEISGKIKADEGKNLIDEDTNPPGAVKESEAVESDKAVALAEKQDAAGQTKATAAGPKGKDTGDKQPAPEFSVQVMATSDVAMALATKEAISQKGVGNPFVSIGKIKESVYLVQAGEAVSTADAAGLKDKLINAGFEAQAQAAGNGKSVVTAGVYSSRKDAESQSGKLAKAGFKAKVTGKKDSSDLYIVKVGGFKTRTEADKAGQSLKAAGFPVMDAAK